MKTYWIEAVPAVLKHLKRIPKNDQKKILSAIEAFARNPRPQGFKKLVYYSDFLDSKLEATASFIKYSTTFF